MKTVKREVSFLDADGKRAVINAEITNRNGYFEFTASGDYLGCGGQCLDRIKPATDKQRELIDLWNKYHLKNIESFHNFDENLIGICEVIEYEEKERSEKQAEESKNKTEDEKLSEKMSEYGIDKNMIDACRAYLDVMSVDDLSDFEESYAGEFASDEEFAEDLAEQCGDIDLDAKWPNNYIDWERAANEIMYDYTKSTGFYFRNI